MTTAKSEAARAAQARPATKPHPTIAALERPSPSGVNAPAFGSDVAADALRALDIPYIALNPGASYRGLHDSIVNYLGNERPQMLLCLHEESAIAIAHGYAKVTGRAMAAAVHSNVGLMHGSMAIFNAWCDRMPVVILGATGPVDADKRRPWIDWIHTAADQGALVRHFTKWDDQPASPAATREAILRANWIANTAPCGPVYVNLDADLQEEQLNQPLPPIDAARYMPPIDNAPSQTVVDEAVTILKAAKRPVILMGRVNRSAEGWDARVALAEAINARVLTDLKTGASFPTDHPLHAGPPGTIRPSEEAIKAVTAADVVVSLDCVDLAGSLKAAGNVNTSAKVIQISLDHRLHNGWSMDYQALSPVDLFVSADPDEAVPALLKTMGVPPRPAKAYAPVPMPAPNLVKGDEKLTVEHMAHALRTAVGTRPTTLTHLSLSWSGAWWPYHHPLDFIGSEGGGGIGGGPGVSVGAALALKGSGRLAVAVVGDGDFLMGVTAIWTAVHYKIPLLFVIANNRSFYNDELHQERMARARNRPVENKWIGQRMTDPDIDLGAMGRAQGAVGFGPINTAAELTAALGQAVAAVEGGAVAVVDVRVEPGYAPAMTAAMMRAKAD
jgi:thiamine pyrophosphate-dependent acetolactate synthase large subunit-like protein